MKKLKILSLLVIIAVLLFQCTKDNESSAWYTTASGTIELARLGTAYELTKNILADQWGIDNEVFVKIDSSIVIACNYKGNLIRKE